MQCFLCDGSINGEDVVRITQGVIFYRKWGTDIETFEFEDGDEEKWIHLACAADSNVEQPSELNADKCHLCGHVFVPEAGPERPGDCVIIVELGVVKAKRSGPFVPGGPRTRFEPYESGIVHCLCACDDWSLPIMSLRAEV